MSSVPPRWAAHSRMPLMPYPSPVCSDVFRSKPAPSSVISSVTRSAYQVSTASNLRGWPCCKALFIASLDICDPRSFCCAAGHCTSLDAAQNSKISGGKTGSAARSADPRSPRFNCLRALNCAHTPKLWVSSSLDSCNHGSRNAYPGRSDSQATTGTYFISNPQCDRHPVFRW